MRAITVDEPTTAFPSCPESRCNLLPSMTRLTDGSLLVVWCGGPPPELALDRFLLCSVSRDDGATWQEPWTVVDTPGCCDINPAVFRNMAGDLVLMHHAWRDGTHHGRLCFSSDDGRTWTEPKPFLDEERWVTQAQGGVPLLLQGRWVMPVHVVRRGKRHMYCCCLMSDDDGATWRRGAGMTTCDWDKGAMEPHILRRSDGSLLMVSRTTSGHPAAATSDDGGESWSEMVLLNDIDSPQAPPRLLDLPGAGWLLAHNAGSPWPGETHHPRNHLVSRTSDDEGRSFSEPVTIDRAETEDIQIAYPTMIALDDNAPEVLVLYHHQPGYVEALTDNDAEIRQARLTVA